MRMPPDPLAAAGRGSRCGAFDIGRAEPATVYRAEGRRFLTLRAACRYAARQKINNRWRASGDDPHEIEPDRYAKMVRRLGRIYQSAALSARAQPKETGNG